MLPKLPPIGWKLDLTVLTLSVLAVGDASNFFASACPSYFTVRQFVSAPEKADNTREDLVIGMAVGWGLTLGVGAAVTVVAKSWWPLIFSAGGAAIMSAMYAHAMANPHGQTGGIAKQ